MLKYSVVIFMIVFLGCNKDNPGKLSVKAQAQTVEKLTVHEQNGINAIEELYRVKVQYSSSYNFDADKDNPQGRFFRIELIDLDTTRRFYRKEFILSNCAWLFYSQLNPIESKKYNGVIVSLVHNVTNRGTKFSEVTYPIAVLDSVRSVYNKLIFTQECIQGKKYKTLTSYCHPSMFDGKNHADTLQSTLKQIDSVDGNILQYWTVGFEFVSTAIRFTVYQHRTISDIECSISIDRQLDSQYILELYLTRIE